MSGDGAHSAGGRPPPSAHEWRRLEPMLDALLDAAPDRRASLIAEMSGGDAMLGSELERLVAECEHAYPLLERPVADRFGAVFGDAPQPLPEMLAGR